MHTNKDPVVKRNFGNVVRNARGYSISELKAAGIDPRLARNNNIQMDRLRKSAHQENIEALQPMAEAIGKFRSTKSKVSAEQPQKLKTKKKSKAK